MAKSNMQKLKEALDKGDLETAKKLSAKIESSMKPPKPPKEPKLTPKIVQPNDNEWLAPSKRGESVGRKILPNGKVLVEARKESIAGLEHPNQFDQWLKGGGLAAVDPKLQTADKKLAKKAIVARPGQVGSQRPVAEKINIQCGGCNRTFEVYPSEIMAVDDDYIYKCDRCIRRGK